jgi:proteic killer suppression protein
MIVSFRDRGTEDIFDGYDTKKARKTLPGQLHDVARKRLEMLNAAGKLSDLHYPPQNKLEALKHDRKGQHSIRMNIQYRICFVWTDAGAELVEIVDLH